MGSLMAKRIDWEAVEKDWIVGILTVAEMSDKHGVSDEGMRKHFMKLGISRDRSKAVRSATKAALIEQSRLRAEELGVEVGAQLANELEVGFAGAIKDQVVDNVSAIGRHKAIIDRQMEALNKMMGDLEVSPEPVLVRLTALQKAVASGAVLIERDRQARNIDEKSDAESFDECILRLDRMPEQKP
jgi:hypothetical protein